MPHQNEHVGGARQEHPEDHDGAEDGGDGRDGVLDEAEGDHQKEGDEEDVSDGGGGGVDAGPAQAVEDGGEEVAEVEGDVAGNEQVAQGQDRVGLRMPVENYIKQAVRKGKKCPRGCVNTALFVLMGGLCEFHTTSYKEL